MRCRSDALGILEALTAAAPSQVCSEYLEPALRLYCNLLSLSARSRSVSARSMQTLLKVRFSQFRATCHVGKPIIIIIIIIPEYRVLNFSFRASTDVVLSSVCEASAPGALRVTQGWVS